MSFIFHLFLMELLVLSRLRAARWWENPLGFPVLLKSRPRKSRTMILCRNFKFLLWQSINGMNFNVLYRFFSCLIAHELFVSLMFVFLCTNLPVWRSSFLYFLQIVIKIIWLVDLANYQNRSYHFLWIKILKLDNNSPLSKIKLIFLLNILEFLLKKWVQ